MVKYFIDSNVFFYAKIMDRKYGKKSASVVHALAGAKIEGVISSLILLELAIALRKYGMADELESVLTSLPALRLDIQSVDSLDVKKAVELFNSYRISPYDCAHVAVMLREGIRNIISADDDFDRVKEVVRIDPLYEPDELWGFSD